MKIKTYKTVTEEVEIDIPEYFEHENYLYKTRANGFTRVYISSITDYVSISTIEKLSIKSDGKIKAITREHFFSCYCKAIELMTGFRYTPESEGAKNNFAQSTEQGLDLSVTSEGVFITDFDDAESDANK